MMLGTLSLSKIDPVKSDGIAESALGRVLPVATGNVRMVSVF